MDKIQTIEKLFLYIVLYSYLLLPLIFFVTLTRSKKLITFCIYGLVVFLLLNLGNHLKERFLYHLSNKIFDPNDELYIKSYTISYTYIEYLFFTLLLWRGIINQKFRTSIIILSSLFFLFLIFFFLNTSISKIDTIPIGIETILLLVYILFFFYQYFKKIDNRYIYNEPCFWVAVGILLYLGGSFFFNILANHLSNTEMMKYYYVTYITEIIKNLLLALAMLIYVFQPKKTTVVKPIPYLDMTS